MGDWVGFGCGEEREGDVGFGFGGKEEVEGEREWWDEDGGVEFWKVSDEHLSLSPSSCG